MSWKILCPYPLCLPLGCGMVGTETEAPNPEYKYCPECRTDAALSAFIRNINPVVRCAERFGVILALEPVARHIVWNPRRAPHRWMKSVPPTFRFCSTR